MNEFFSNFSTLVIFLHLLGAIVWLGGMITIRYTIHYSMQNIKEPKIKLERILENLQRFFNIVIPSIILIVLTAIIMIVALNFKETDLYKYIIAKEIIYTIMTINFVYIYIKRNKAQRYFEKNDFQNTKIQLEPLAKYLIPINIFLGLIAVFIGVILRGF